MGFCCSKRKDETEGKGDIDEDFSYEELRNKIKKEINHIHAQFNDNIEDAMNNPIFFTMERIKLVLSEFSDAIASKIINSPNTLEDKEFLMIDQFMNELEEINKIKSDEEYTKLLEKYNALIEKVSKINVGLNDEIDIEEKKEENNSGVMNESNKK